MSQKSCSKDNLSFTDVFISNMIQILFEEGSDEFWKCLKYNSNDALTNPSYFVTAVEKYKMIKQNTADTRIKRLRFCNDISVEAHSEIRIFDDWWEESQPRIFDIGYGIEVISHNAIITLDGTGYSRLNVFRNELLRLFNGRVVEGNTDELSVLGHMGKHGMFNDNFQGYKFTIAGTST